MDAETGFYVRIILLLFKGGMLVCRGLVDRELKENGLDEILKEKELYLKQKLIKSQYFMLFPRTGVTPDPQDFDLSLLIVLLLDVFNIPACDRREIEKIKKIRTKTVHSGKISLDESAYNYMKGILKNALTNISADLDGSLQKECEDLIKTFLIDPLDEAAAVHYINGIRNDEEVLQRVHEMLQEQKEDIAKMITEAEERVTEKFENRMAEQDKILDDMIQASKGYHGDNAANNLTEDNVPKDPPLCEECIKNGKSNPAEFHCRKCNSNMCSECHHAIHIQTLLISMKSHHIQDVKISQGNIVDMRGMDICEKHSFYLTYFCKHDEVLCCERCVSEQHSNCKYDVCKIDRIAESSPNYMLDPVAEIDRLRKSIESIDHWMLTFEEEFKKHIENIPNILKEKREKMIDLYDKKATEVITKASDLRDEKLPQIRKSRSQCNALMCNTDQTKQTLLRIASAGSPSERFIAYQNQRSKIKTYEKDFSFIKNKYKTPLDFSDFPIFEEIAQALGPLSLNIPNIENDHEFIIET